MPKIIGYLRVSTDTQDVENQKHEIEAYASREGMTVDTWIQVEMSSRRSTRERRLDETLDLLKRGDSLIVSELSRIGRSIRENLNILHELGKKGVTTHIVKQGLRTNGKNDVLATMLLANVSFAAELERDLISQRTKAALARKKAEGKKLGSPKLDELHAKQAAAAKEFSEAIRGELEALIREGKSQRVIMNSLNEKGIRTIRGNRWSLPYLQSTLKRLGLITRRTK